MTARILIVDDVTANGRLLEACLTENYYVVKFLSDSTFVQDTVKEWEPDAILLDIMMPNMDGYEVCRLLKSDSSTAHIPVIMITALKDQLERRHGLAVGADEFLVKPVETEILLARLRGIVRLKQLLDEWRARGDSASALGLIGQRVNDLPIAAGSALIVEDFLPRSLFVRDALLKGGIHSIVVEAREAASLSISAEDNFDLIIISLSLMSAHPLRILATLRASAEIRDTPILVMAEADQRDLLINALDLGANDCISVPLDEAELLLRAKSHIQRKRYQDRLRADVGSALELATIDPLTKSFNRRYLMTVLDRLCKDKKKPAFAVLMIDADNFKAINDIYGHSIGDHVLIDMAEIIRQGLRKTDIFARYGGEEFIVILTNTPDIRQARYVAEKLRSMVEKSSFKPKLHVTISVGVAMCYTEMSAANALKAADKALYKAKSNGRNQTICHEDNHLETEQRTRFEP